MERRQTPGVQSGLVELAVDDRRSTAIHQLVASVTSSVDGTLYWIDNGGTASTYVMNEQFDRRRRRGTRIARAFTAYQHYSLVRHLVETATGRVSMVVVPNVCQLYQDEDVPDYENTRLLQSSLRVLEAFATTSDVPVVMSAPGSSPEHRDLVERHSTERIVTEQTEFGPRFEGEDFETTVYWDRGGWQTTVPYWVELVGAVGEARAPPTASSLAGDRGPAPVPEPTVQGV
jgi:hypothetical protein